MKTRKLENKTWKFPIILFIVFLVFIIVIFIRFVYLSLSKTVDDINLQDFALNRNTYSKTLYAKRGTIYDSKGDILAVNVSSYTVIAYLSESRSKGSSKPLHVVDKELTAKKLSPIINMSENQILNLLNQEGLYQVELGPGGRNITELQKDAIIELELPGIDFIESTKRYYPNGNFASYIIGYAKKIEEEQNYIITGELGIESYYDTELKGENGYIKYEQDRDGYKIPDTTEIKLDAKNGKDIYLTLDSGIQRFLESAIDNTVEKYDPEWAMYMVMDAQTADILGSATTPSFDPNILDIEEYENPLVSRIYEPGSTMKTYTYICALEKGTYDGQKKFKSGSYKIGNDIIYDALKTGWGEISYDEGYLRSSNVGVSNIMNSFIDKKDLKECLLKYGFGKKTSIELPREQIGNIDFNYDVEVASAAFGQGISITAIQALQAITLISNDGKMLKPHIISKIVDTDSNKVEYERKVEESEQLISVSTVEYMKDLMYRTVYGDNSFNYYGNGFGIENFDIIGKTGTAQFYENGYYSSGGNNYIYSFIGMFPKEKPEVIVYVVMKKPQSGGNSALKESFKDIATNIAKYKNIYNSNSNKSLNEIKLNNYINKNVLDAKTELEKNKIKSIIIGTGNKVIDTYPKSNTTLIENDRVILYTSSDNIKMPSLINWSYKEVNYFCNVLNLNCNIKGNGYVLKQNIEVNSLLNENTILELELNDKNLAKDNLNS